MSEKSEALNVASHYEDHIGLWSREIRDWLPDCIFDAHVHLGPPDAMGTISYERRGPGLAAFTALTYEEYGKIAAYLFRGKKIAGVITFGFPLREVNIRAANAYTACLIRDQSNVKGFLLCNPADIAGMVEDFRAWEKRGVRFHGVKPYFDFLGKSNYETDWSELLPSSLLEFAHAEGLPIMLHTCRNGMGDVEAQAFVKSVADNYPRIRVILAHMGRYLRVEPILQFLESDLLLCPSLYLETSIASNPEVYTTALRRKAIRDRLLFGTDIPYGLWTGVENWSEETGPVCLTRDSLAAHPEWQTSFGIAPQQLTYNVYHVIHALKQSMERLHISEDESLDLRRKVFCSNAQRLFSRIMDTCASSSPSPTTTTVSPGRTGSEAQKIAGLAKDPAPPNMI